METELKMPFTFSSPSNVCFRGVFAVFCVGAHTLFLFVFSCSSFSSQGRPVSPGFSLIFFFMGGSFPRSGGAGAIPRPFLVPFFFFSRLFIQFFRFPFGFRSGSERDPSRFPPLPADRLRSSPPHTEERTDVGFSSSGQRGQLFVSPFYNIR